MQILKAWRLEMTLEEAFDTDAYDRESWLWEATEGDEVTADSGRMKRDQFHGT